MAIDDDFLFEEDYDETIAEEIPDRECYKCGESNLAAQLELCRVCRREFCGDCAVKGHWGRFCSETCHEAYFYGDGENEDDDEDQIGGDAG
jgi:hypothetical protein